MNWLQGVIYDWQQYLKSATDQLESSKIDKTGAADLSGAFLPAVTRTGVLGLPAGVGDRLWGAAAIDNLEVDNALVREDLTMLSTARVKSNFVPDSSRSLGLVGEFWLNLFAFNIQLMRSVQPASANDLTLLNRLNNIVAWAEMTGAGTSTGTSTYGAKKYNVTGATATRTGTGSYTLTFNTPIPAGCVAVVTGRGSGGLFVIGNWTLSTTQIDIQRMTLVGTPAPASAIADGTFTVLVFGPVA